MSSVHIPEAKYLLLKVSTTTLSPIIWHNEDSTHPWGQVSTAEGQYYYLESNYMTHEVSTHHWDQVSTARCQHYYLESNYMTQWGQYTSLRPSIYCYMSVLLPWVPVFDTMRTVHIPEAKFLLIDVNTTTLSPSIWHNEDSSHPGGQVSTAEGQYYYIESNYMIMRSVHISEAKYLLIEVSTTNLSPSTWHNEVSTHPWGQVSTAEGQYYYLESQYLTQLGQYTSLWPSFYC